MTIHASVQSYPQSARSRTPQLLRPEVLVAVLSRGLTRGTVELLGKREPGEAQATKQSKHHDPGFGVHS